MNVAKVLLMQGFMLKLKRLLAESLMPLTSDSKNLQSNKEHFR